MNVLFYELQLSAMDASARTTMKGAAKCDKRCELQNSVNQQGFERILCFRDSPESIPASVSMPFISHRSDLLVLCGGEVSVCQDAFALDAFNASVTRLPPSNRQSVSHAFLLLGRSACLLSSPSGLHSKT